MQPTTQYNNNILEWFLPEVSLQQSAELFNSHSIDIRNSSYTLLPNVGTYSNAGWNFSNHSKDSTPVDGSVVSDTSKHTKSASLEKVQSACSKPYKFIRDETKSSPFDMSFFKFGLPKSK